MWFGVLGPLEVRDGGGVAVDVGPPQRRKVLSALLAEAGLVVATDRLVQAVWGEEADSSHIPALQAHVSRLRSSLGPELVRTQRPGYQLVAADVKVDAVEAEDLAAKARVLMSVEDWPTAHEKLRASLGLWRGVPYGEFVGERFFEWEIDRLEDLRLSMSEDLAEVSLELGEDSAVVALLEGLIRENPLRERLRALLMVALYRSGRQSDALAVYGDLRRYLADELGLEPSREIQELEIRILNHDPDLASPDTRAATAATTTVRRKPLSSVRGCLIVNGERILLDKAVTTLGRLADRDIVIDDDEASRRHAEIRRLPDGYFLVDVGSTNGTLVNGEAVVDHHLYEGDVITVGAVDLTYMSL